MPNTMFSRNNQQSSDFLSQFNRFKNDLAQSGKNPQSYLNELMNSGKYSQADLNKAKMMANMFVKYIK